MAVLRFKTKGKPFGQGKQKIYFCAHPDDYGLYLKKISDKVLDTLEKNDNRNCAFFYLEDPRAPRDEEFFGCLREMNLFIMPITTELLTTANPALDADFRFAVENNIPILPLMQESALDAVFNEKCGDLQFLNPNSNDTTAISYDEKLTKYLVTHLVNDELAEQIRKEFDAYIFLSYRKKDRKYARKLMNLIHKIDFCRDIAIWYDEFLTPGEDFNESIKDALEKSKLFALAVTPSLLEKTVDKDGRSRDNYIITTEYPMARVRVEKGELAILPAELEKTKKAALAKKYPGIPFCIDAYDGIALGESLLEKLSGIALRKNDSDCRHNYLIGLAYLDGVDVEKDSDIALSLITSAAEEGFTDAIEKLISVYQRGNGTARDPEKALQWQGRLADIKKKEYSALGTEASAKKYIETLTELGDSLRQMLKYSEAERIFGEMLLACEEIYERFGSQWACHQIAVSYERIGGVKPDHAGEKEYIEKAAGILKKLAEETSAPWILGDLAITYDRFGDICLSTDDFEGAKEYFLKALDIRSNVLLESFGIFAYGQDDIALSYIKLGRVCFRRQDYDGAKGYYLKALEKTKRLADTFARDDTKRLLADVYDRLGGVHNLQGYFEAAMGYYADAFAVREELWNKKCTVQASIDLLRSCLGFACALLEMKRDVEGAEKYLLRALDIYDEIPMAAISPDTALELSVIYEQLGDIKFILGDVGEAREYYSRRLRLIEDLSLKTDTRRLKRDLSVTYNKLGDIELQRRAIDTAKFYYNQSLTVRLEICRTSNDSTARSDLAVNYMKLGEAYRAERNFETTEKYYLSALDIVEKLILEDKDAYNYRILATLCNNYGDIYLFKNDLDRAEEYYLRTLDIYTKVLPEPDPNSVAVCQSRLNIVRQARTEKAIHSAVVAEVARQKTEEKDGIYEFHSFGGTDEDTANPPVGDADDSALEDWDLDSMEEYVPSSTDTDDGFDNEEFDELCSRSRILSKMKKAIDKKEKAEKDVDGRTSLFSDLFKKLK